MRDHPGLISLIEPIRSIKTHMLNYLSINHSKIISQACVGEFPIDELLSGQVEEEVNSLLKIVHRFKEDLAGVYTELQYGEPAMEEDAKDHAPNLKEDSIHWAGVELELKPDKT